MNIRKKLHKGYYDIQQFFNFLLERNIHYNGNFKAIPIIINNRNRYSFLIKLITSLTKRGYNNIHIIDNNSSYPPLLEYYRTCPFKVFRLGTNVGYLAFWKTGIYKQFTNNYFVYTDPDLELIDECPDDFMQYFIKILQGNYKIQKVGFGLKYNDLPDSFRQKHQVIEWEKAFYNNKYSENEYVAHIDTTFALYRPRAKGGSHDYKMCIRTTFPYECRHLPWYVDSDNLTEEEEFYIKNATTSTFWTQKNDLYKR